LGYVGIIFTHSSINVLDWYLLYFFCIPFEMLGDETYFLDVVLIVLRILLLAKFFANFLHFDHSKKMFVTFLKFLKLTI